MTTWKEFWNQENSVYVSRRHMDVHFKAVAQDTISLLPTERPLILLDWGCGEALAADDFLAVNISLLLYDPVSRAQNYLRSRFDESNVHVLSDNEAFKLEKSSVDVIFINSVLQYMSVSDFENLLPYFHKTLKEHGVLIVADIVTPHVSIVSDVYHLLRSGLRHGFFIDACIGIIKTFFSTYRLIRKEQGFTMYTEEHIKEIFSKYGFSVEKRPNVGLSPHRMLMYAIKK